MRSLVSSLLWVGLLACAAPGGEPGPDAGPDAGDSQASYEYPGCPNEDYVCPRLKTVFCAVETIRQKHDSPCAQASDCTQVVLADDCVGVSSCGGVVMSTAGASAFREEAQAEVDRYCGPSPGCRASGSCVPMVTACMNGRCVATMVMDGGS